MPRTIGPIQRDILRALRDDEREKGWSVPELCDWLGFQERTQVYESVKALRARGLAESGARRRLTPLARPSTPWRLTPAGRVFLAKEEEGEEAGNPGG